MTARPPSASSHRDGWLSAAARKSPRGTVTRLMGVVPTAARNWRCADRDAFLGADQSCRDPLGVPEQRVDLGRWGQEPVGCTDDDDQIDVEAARPGERADVDAVADLAVAGRCDLELCDERGAELGARDGRTDRVQMAEARQHELRALPRVAFGPLEAVEPAPPEPPVEPFVRPRHPVGPGPHVGR